MAISTLLLGFMRLVLATLFLGLFSPLVYAEGGSIEVSVLGAPGEILLDSFPTGKMAPATLEGVAAGEHEITLAYGCMSGVERVLVEEGRIVTANLQMNNEGGVGTVRLRNLPTGADVWVDDAPGKFVDGISELPCGAHRLLVEVPGYFSWQETVVITTGKWTQVTPVMEVKQVEEPAFSTNDYRDEDAYLEDELDAVSDDFEFSNEYDYADEEDDQNEYFDEFDTRQRESDYAPRTPDELSGLDGPAWRTRSSDRASLTKRVLMSTVMGVGGLISTVVAIDAGAENNAFIVEYTKLYQFEPNSVEAQQYWKENIQPVRIKAGLCGVGAVVGIGGAAAVMMFLDVSDTYVRVGAGGRF